MNQTYEHDFNTADNIVYVRPVALEDLPDEIREQAEGLTELYAVHNGEGERLALVRDRKLAFVVARQNDMAPVSVH
ncbi:DUF1150 family protein [Palleronia abyssalis]|uniref:DUF1150 domain-containing protein n=1 Tax=Palleronia abyssalis TaxID=1501240 RepID=A0A2R8C0C4_9RHOB|nr:DUF1150 family protein [Palleronia abyssalis]SPJ25871.1 hypothetical protein PAA8504_03723 [Palleronia abyssalis]